MDVKVFKTYDPNIDFSENLDKAITFLTGEVDRWLKARPELTMLGCPQVYVPGINNNGTCGVNPWLVVFYTKK